MKATSLIPLLAAIVLTPPALGAPPPLFEPQRPGWEIPFSTVSNRVLSVMPGESGKTFFDPLLKREVKWEQDVYCPTFAVFAGQLYCVYRAWGEDEQWRMGLAWSEDGVNFIRSDHPVFHARPTDEFLGDLRKLDGASVSYGDSRMFQDEDGTAYLFFNYFSHGVVNDQELAIATTRDFKNWKMHGRAFSQVARRDRDLVPESAPRRLPHPAIVTELKHDRLVVRKINGKYWMYVNILATKGPYKFGVATSDNMLDWRFERDEAGGLVHPMAPRPGYFDSRYMDTTAAVLRDDGILLIYNGINAEPAKQGDVRRKPSAHYPAQALFDRQAPHLLLARSESPFRGGDPELEKQPIVFWSAPLYESWSLVPWNGELLLYWNHNFGRRAVGLWKAPIPASMGRARTPPE
jgi:predicted GH43/DUF377 family glycosyl hydrolase